MAMYEDGIPLNVKGRYYWELLFKYKNSLNSGQIEKKVKYTKEITVDYKTLISNTNTTKATYDYGSSKGGELKIKKGTETSSATHSLHLEMANEIITSFEKQTVTNEKIEFEDSFTIGANSELKVYRLIYEAGGQVIKSNIFSTEPEEDIFVELNFLYTSTLPGFEIIETVLRETFPKKDNKDEWSRIRNSIIDASDSKSVVDRFHGILRIMSDITPKNENKKEWENIRRVCNQILEKWNSTEDKVPYFKKFATCLATIRPERANKKEWEEIRKAATDILKHMTTTGEPA